MSDNDNLRELLQRVLAETPDWQLAIIALPLGMLVVYRIRNGGGDLDPLRRGLQALQPLLREVPVWRLMGTVARAAVELYQEITIYRGRQSGGVEREDPRASQALEGPDLEEGRVSGGGGGGAAGETQEEKIGVE